MSDIKYQTITFFNYNYMKQFTSDVEAANSLSEAYKRLNDEISKVIIGQDEVIRLALISIFCQGHSLLIGVPGLAKTLADTNHFLCSGPYL